MNKHHSEALSARIREAINPPRRQTATARILDEVEPLSLLKTFTSEARLAGAPAPQASVTPTPPVSHAPEGVSVEASPPCVVVDTRYHTDTGLRCHCGPKCGSRRLTSSARTVPATGLFAAVSALSWVSQRDLFDRPRSAVSSLQDQSFQCHPRHSWPREQWIDSPAEGKTWRKDVGDPWKPILGLSTSCPTDSRCQPDTRRLTDNPFP